MSARNILLICVIALLAGVACFFWYVNSAFPATRCEAAKHLDAPEKYADCVECHTKVTPKVTQDWKESKHGVMLVKCVVCHGQPDGKGSIPFAAQPDAMNICVRCHDPSIQRMVAKYGEKPNCNSCHPYHQNPMHSDAYETRIPSGKTTF